MPKQKLIIVAYVPVVHRGYMALFDHFAAADTLYVLGKDLLSLEDYIRKDIRALSPGQQVKVITGLGRFQHVRILNYKSLAGIDSPSYSIVMPDEDISRSVAAKLKHAKVTLYPVFLRWDRNSIDANQHPEPDIPLSRSAFDTKMINKAYADALRSSDIWRRVGAAIVKDKKILLHGHNTGEPSPFSPMMEGDPRNPFNKGKSIEMSVFSHAEALLIARAAKEGLALAGASMYMTTFPCPACAKLIAHSGIKTCYFHEGYAILDGRRVMEAYGVKIVRVDIEPETKVHPKTWVPYK